jgi:site-specific recombinase XerD
VDEAPQPVHDLLLREEGRARLLEQNTRIDYRLSQLKASWLATLDSPASVPVYARDLDQFLDYCIDHDLNPLTVDIPAFNLFVTWLKLQTTRYGRPYKNATLVRKVDEIASFYNHLVDVDALDRSPVTKKGRPKRQPQKLDKALTRTEARTVTEDAATGHRTLGALCAQLINELIFTMGIRVSEVCNLDLDQLYWTEGRGFGYHGIKFIGKGGKVHDRRIPAILYSRFLVPYIAQRPTPASLEHATALLLTLKGERVNRFQVYRLVGRAYDRGKIDRKATPHFGRHTFNDVAKEAGFSIEQRQLALGHKSSVTTQGYGAARRSLIDDPSGAVADWLHADDDGQTEHDPLTGT